ncbi:MAG: EAL domain-containing protein [Wenzhouxiangellaceae bacterium]|nr:EAL domain-containing protein [Wenzhouxiangellaceae bacterium]
MNIFKHTPWPSRVNWFTWLVAVLLLGGLLTCAAILFQQLRQSENDQIDRYLDSIAQHIETDLHGTAGQQASVQARMAMRLAFDGPFDRAAWAADAARLIEAHPYYDVLAVLDADYRVRWLAGGEQAAIAEGRPFPLSVEAIGRLAEIGPEMVSIALEPLQTASGQPAILFMTPVIADDEISNWLAAVMVVPDSVKAMLTGFYLRDVILDGSFAGVDFIISEGAVGQQRSEFARQLEFPLNGGRSSLSFNVALKSSTAEQIRTALPATVLVLGSILAILMVASVLLGLAATRQARYLAGANISLKHEIRDRQLAEQELAFLLTHDSLTGLPNRQGMLRQLEQSIEELIPGRRLAVLFIDLDQFKDVNETLGHHLGDELLRLIPDRLQAELDDPDVIGRLGGDEYLVSLQRKDAARIERLAVNLLKSLERPFQIEEHQLFVTASIGIAYLDAASPSPGELIQNADAALFRAKQLGRNQFALFVPEMFAEVEYRLNLSRDIRRALDEGRFKLAYQPIVDLESLEIRGVEALLRWPHEDGYFVPPQDFIRVAEETGMVHRLSQYALAQAVSDLAAWHAQSDDPPFLAVNISGVQFRETDFVRDLSLLLHHHRISPGCVHLEITEDVLIENLSLHHDVLKQLDDIGTPIVVDDFGVGYSSLAYIKNFPVSTIKIDQGFIRGLGHDADDRAITRTICDLSRELSLLTVAEGIEQMDQLELLRAFGCNLGQGYLFMRASSAEAITAVLNGEVPWRDLAGRNQDEAEEISLATRKNGPQRWV